MKTITMIAALIALMIPSNVFANNILGRGTGSTTNGGLATNNSPGIATKSTGISDATKIGGIALPKPIPLDTLTPPPRIDRGGLTGGVGSSSEAATQAGQNTTGKGPSAGKDGTAQDGKTPDNQQAATGNTGGIFGPDGSWGPDGGTNTRAPNELMAVDPKLGASPGIGTSEDTKNLQTFYQIDRPQGPPNTYCLSVDMKQCISGMQGNKPINSFGIFQGKTIKFVNRSTACHNMKTTSGPNQFDHTDTTTSEQFLKTMDHLDDNERIIECMIHGPMLAIGFTVPINDIEVTPDKAHTSPTMIVNNPNNELIFTDFLGAGLFMGNRNPSNMDAGMNPNDMAMKLGISAKDVLSSFAMNSLSKIDSLFVAANTSPSGSTPPGGVQQLTPFPWAGAAGGRGSHNSATKDLDWGGRLAGGRIGGKYAMKGSILKSGYVDAANGGGRRKDLSEEEELELRKKAARAGGSNSATAVAAARKAMLAKGTAIPISAFAKNGRGLASNKGKTGFEGRGRYLKVPSPYVYFGFSVWFWLVLAGLTSLWVALYRSRKNRHQVDPSAKGL